MTGELELIEDIGSDRFLHLLCDGVEIVARSGKTVEFEPGDLISLNVAATAWHFFRAGTRVDV
jgi:ABC-type sugar transport system ATPase subunit